MNAPSRKNLRRYPANPIEVISTLAMGALLIWAVQPLRTETPQTEGYRAVLGAAKLDATLSGRALASGQTVTAESYPTLNLECVTEAKAATSATLTAPSGAARVRFAGNCAIESIIQKDPAGGADQRVARFTNGGHFTSAYAPLTGAETTFEFELTDAAGKPHKITRKVVR